MKAYKHLFCYIFIKALGGKQSIHNCQALFLAFFFFLDHLEDETEEDDLFETEFRQYKRTYYMTKMGVDIVSEYGFANVYYTSK